MIRYCCACNSGNCRRCFKSLRAINATGVPSGPSFTQVNMPCTLELQCAFHMNSFCWCRWGSSTECLALENAQRIETSVALASLRTIGQAGGQSHTAQLFALAYVMSAWLGRGQAISGKQELFAFVLRHAALPSALKQSCQWQESSLVNTD